MKKTMLAAPVLLLLLSGCESLNMPPIEVGARLPGGPEVRIAIGDEQPPLVEGVESSPLTDEGGCIRLGSIFAAQSYQLFIPGEARSFEFNPTDYRAFNLVTGELLPLPLDDEASRGFNCRYRSCTGPLGGPGAGGFRPACHGCGALLPSRLVRKFLDRLREDPANPLGLPNPNGEVCPMDDLDCRYLQYQCENRIIRAHNARYGTAESIRGRLNFPPIETDPPLPLPLAQRFLERCLDPFDRTCAPWSRSVCRIPNACGCFDYSPERIEPFSGIRPERLAYNPLREECDPVKVVAAGEPPEPPEPPSQPERTACEELRRAVDRVCLEGGAP